MVFHHKISLVLKSGLKIGCKLYNLVYF